MLYEFHNAVRAVREEGILSLPRKMFIYFSHVGGAMRFFTLQTLRNATPAEALDFTFNKAGKLIAPSQFRSEIFQLSTRVHQLKPKTIVEIGTEKGGTLSIWCAIADPNATIVSIDLPGGIHGGGYPNWRKHVYRRFTQPNQKLYLLRLDSHQADSRDRLKTLIPSEGIDFLFIDGDHTYDGVKMDFEMYSPLVRRGGLVAFHDIVTHPPEKKCDVDKFWREVKMKYKSWEFIENPNQDKYGIGLLEM